LFFKRITFGCEGIEEVRTFFEILRSLALPVLLGLFHLPFLKKAGNPQQVNNTFDR